MLIIIIVSIHFYIRFVAIYILFSDHKKILYYNKIIITITSHIHN